MYDETISNHNLIILDIFVRYWSGEIGGITEKTLEVKLLGHVTATNIANSTVNVMKTSKVELNYLS